MKQERTGGRTGVLNGHPSSTHQRPKKQSCIAVIGPRLRILLHGVLAGFGLLCMNSVYLLTVTSLESIAQRSYQGVFYLSMFLGHLALGLVFVGPALLFAGLHIRNAYQRPNRRAVRAGVALFGAILFLLLSGLVLTQYSVFAVRNPTVRSLAYWVHVVSPLLAIWLFVLHRLAGPRIQWGLGLRWAGAAIAVVVGAIGWLLAGAADRTSANSIAVGSTQSVQRFAPSLAQTVSGGTVSPDQYMQDQYCQECHADIHQNWSSSAHRLSSFNNPAYLFSIRETRAVLLERDGNVTASRFCAACHDPVPLFSGAFDDPNFDHTDPTAQVGITCSVCHAVSAISSPRGNGAYVLSEPVHYPFTFSDNSVLRGLSRQLVKAKPDFHKKTFLKPLHRTAEFCGTCHKVHIPEALNKYRWLRGQNHYDTFLLSGVSGHGVSSFYYPDQAQKNCNSCHMPLQSSTDFGARYAEPLDALAVHSHLFPGANTALTQLLELPEEVLAQQQAFLKDSLRVDIFGLREGGTIEGRQHAPIRPEIPVLEPGKTYLIDVVLRTLRVGHTFTQGTTDSNEVWVDIQASHTGEAEKDKKDEQVLGHSGSLAEDGTVDPWAHFVNSYVLDRHGQRIDRRNVQDIFVPLYSHQIPPGAADVIHYRLQVPKDAQRSIVLEAKLQYRKFDTGFTRQFLGAEFVHNDLPITTIASDRVVFPIAGSPRSHTESEASSIPVWERWNDYGIGSLRKSGTGANRGELRQATAAFSQVEQLGRPDGPLNLARVYLQEGRLDEAAAALRRAANFDPPAPAWTVTWLTGLVNQQTGHFEAATANFRSLVEMDTAETRRRGLDFSRDYRLLNELGKSLFEQAKQERRNPDNRQRLLSEAATWFERSLELDPENTTAHYNLTLIAAQSDDQAKATHHGQLHERYRVDENARDRAVTIARRENPAADHAAEAVVIYDLQPPSDLFSSQR